MDLSQELSYHETDLIQEYMERTPAHAQEWTCFTPFMQRLVTKTMKTASNLYSAGSFLLGFHRQQDVNELASICWTSFRQKSVTKRDS